MLEEESMAKQTAITDLPDEIIHQILSYLSPLEVLFNIQRTSRRLARIGNEPLLWRHHCRTNFNYWDSKHRISQKFAGNVDDVDWKKLFFYRKDVDFQTTTALDSILSRQIRRIEEFDRISQFGYDAKDVLLRHCQTRDTAEDVLARRFYSTAVLDHVHRSMALEVWQKLSKGENVPLERALGSFDMFVLHDERGDLAEISDLLDTLIRKMRITYPYLENLSPRRKAIAAAQFLRANNLTGIASDSHYRDLQNNYIGIALQHDDHPSLPLISVAIYCAVAQRLGLDARCCGFPAHVHAIIYPKFGETLDGSLARAGNVPEPMYLDPYRSDEEIPIADLRTQLVAWGVSSVDFPRLLRDSSTRNIVLRTSRNILATVHDFRGLGGAADNTGHPTIRLYANPFADMDNAFYSALWANFMLCNSSPGPEPIEQIQFIPLILERFERLYPMDAAFIERFVYPMSRNVTGEDQWTLLETLRVVRAGDAMPKQIRKRDTPASKESVKFRVGQVFQHKRYHYTAVITGWDIECSMNSQWIAQNNVDALSRGRHQSFYHALVEDTSIRYVAEENVEIIELEFPASLMSLAGRFFKRWNRDTHSFVSNIRDEYPDD